MPTRAEYQEVIDDTRHGSGSVGQAHTWWVDGTSLRLLMPPASCYSDGSNRLPGWYLFYWSSTLITSAKAAHVHEEYQGPYLTVGDRSIAMSVKGVLGPYP